MMVPSADAAGAQVVMRILATTDLHAEIRAFDYALRRADPSKGLSRAASVIEALSRDAPGRLLVDNGDFLFGRSFGGLPDRGAGGVAEAMNALGYDAGMLGNHEFDAGIDTLRMALGRVRHPVVCANLRWADGRPFVRPDIIVTRDLPDAAGIQHRVRIGITGVLPPRALAVSGPLIRDRLRLAPVAESAAARTADLRARGADLVLALCHDGPGADGAGDPVRELAGVAGIDALVLGHTHGTFPGPDFAAMPGVEPERGLIHGKPAVMPGFWGRQVGRIDLTLRRDRAGWRVEGAAVACHPVARRSVRDRIEPLVPCAPEVLRASRPLHLSALRDGQRGLGRIGVPLSTHFTRLGHCRATRLVARSMRCAMERRVRDTALDGVPIVGLAAPSHCGGLAGPHSYVDLAAGPVFEADLRMLHAHRDRIVGLVTDGAALALWLERSVSALNRVRAGRFVPGLVDPRFPASDFDLPDPVQFEIDLSRAALFDAAGRRVADGPGRITAMEIAGRRIEPRHRVILAVTAHRCGGGGGFPRPADGQLIETDETVPVATQLLLSRSERMPAPRIFRFRPIPFAAAAFETGPGAVRHRPALPDLPMRDAGIGSAGFLSYVLGFGPDP